LLLQRELESTSPLQPYDLLVLDAFTSDAIPIHLITDEAFILYTSLLAADGVLAFNVSNRYLDPELVLARLSLEHDYPFVFWRHSPSGPVDDDHSGIDDSAWLLISKNEAFLSQPAFTDKVVRPAPNRNRFPVSRWTDDFHNLFEILHW
jgi:hypothetical protein